MRIGELAQRAAVNIQTIRFYEREGLLRQPHRTASGYRSYEAGDLERVTFIRICQGLGFTLREIQQLIDLHRLMAAQESGANTKPSLVHEIIVLATERISSMDEKIQALSKMRSSLLSVVTSLTTTNPAICPASISALPAKK